MVKKGRPTRTTPEAIDKLIGFIAEGDSEQVACAGAGFSASSLAVLKRERPELRERLAKAREEYCQKRHARARAERKAAKEAAREASRENLLKVQLALGSNKRPPKKLKPAHQAVKVVWRLVNRVPLSVVQITPEHLKEACDVMNYTTDAFMRQDEVFKLMEKVYRRRANLRGDFGIHQATKAKLFPQTAAYRQPVSWNHPLPDLPGVAGDPSQIRGLGAEHWQIRIDEIPEGWVVGGY